MKKHIILGFVSITTVSALLLLTNFAFKENGSLLVRGELPLYTLSLDSNQKIVTSETPSSGESSGYVYTANHNSVLLSASNMVNNAGGWETLLPGGYVYNPVTQVGDNNKISGIKSIQYTGNGSLEFHYGYSLNNEEVLYSFEQTINAGEEFYIETKAPSYFYLKNVGESNVNINTLTLKYSCIAEDFPDNNLKVLIIGNSFADDTVYYSARIANSLGINLQIYDAYIGGCTLDMHYSNIQSGAATYSMRSMNGSSWNYQNDMSLSQIVTYKDWDIITFQQASAEIGRPGTYDNLVNLVNEVKSRVTGNPKYYWHQTWAYDRDYSEESDQFSYFNNDQLAMFDAIVDCYNDYVVPTGIFEKTIYNGTAVQNIRTSNVGDTITKDGKHMTLVHGRYLVATNFISSIYGIDLELSPIPFKPNEISSYYQNTVFESIRNARKYPDRITQSNYTLGSMEGYDLSNYTEIDAGLVGCSYYNSTDSSKFRIRLSNTSGTSNVYVTSNRFTPTTLPIGSIIFVNDGLGYRPEAWVNDAQQSVRKGEEYKTVINIDDSFWNGYAYRAFNIFKTGKSALADDNADQQYDDIFNGFRIFVPNDKMDGLTPKNYNPNYSDDKDLFINNGLDIDNYERIHLDPITGFYKCDSYFRLQNSYIDDTAQRFVCTRPFYTSDNELSSGTVIIVDSGYQWRSDCWGDLGKYNPRPNNVSTRFKVLDSSFMSGFRRRTFNVSSTSSNYVYQNYISFINHMRIYSPK